MNRNGLIELSGLAVQPEWIDYNGHMNVAYYLLAFDKITDSLWDFMGIGIDYVKRTNRSTFTLENHMTFVREVKLGDPLKFTFQLLDHDRKKFHFFGRMYHATQDYVSSTMEWMTLHVDLNARRGTEMDGRTYARFAEVKRVHAQLPRPSEVGRTIGMTQKRAG
ncbi:MAG: hypothetical protein EXQ91_01620 [Alphaproteobacteria bacterium]|nr:hypothetical protein [Alphaproteobacteria bacterium]